MALSATEASKENLNRRKQRKQRGTGAGLSELLFDGFPFAREVRTSRGDNLWRLSHGAERYRSKQREFEQKEAKETKGDRGWTFRVVVRRIPVRARGSHEPRGQPLAFEP